MADREGLEAQERQAQAFGEWLTRARGGQGLTQEQAAERAGVSRVQWARWEKGNGLPKRSNIPAVARAVRHANEAEVYRRAGYEPPSDPFDASYVSYLPGPIRNTADSDVLDTDFHDDDPILLSIIAHYRGSPPDLHPKMLGEIAKLVRENQQSQTTFGKRADEPKGGEAREDLRARTKRDIDELVRILNETQQQLAESQELFKTLTNNGNGTTPHEPNEGELAEKA